MMPPPGVMGLGRMDLAEYTDVALTPAYANDLIAQEKEFVWPKADITLLNGVGSYHLCRLGSGDRRECSRHHRPAGVR